ncbi:flagellar export protein FliJ [Aliidiomarina iranensis]|uniref:Flagellar FliJ protein n=1 Tax=Aliidiomarina iranensis TaxID=1434071 RepID=A0A432W1V8_9GAMM|nr:flagellar export protein FliJ [Aliidiomarina iranensis]RUO23205.1 flagellar export protein FliJ [Aliidiomarina iranensis]
MSGSTALDTLTDLAKEARDKAGQLLATERTNEQQILAHQEMLVNYREEYAVQLQKLMLNGIDPVTLYNYRQFLMSLDESIQKASKALQQQSTLVDKSKQNWQQQQRKLTSYTTLNDRRAAAANRISARKEQLQTDEFANNQHVRGGHLTLIADTEKES